MPLSVWFVRDLHLCLFTLFVHPVPHCVPPQPIWRQGEEVSSLPPLFALLELVDSSSIAVSTIPMGAWPPFPPPSPIQGIPGEPRDIIAVCPWTGLGLWDELMWWFLFLLLGLWSKIHFVTTTQLKVSPLPSLLLPFHFSCLKTTCLSLSQSFLFTNISKVNSCGCTWLFLSLVLSL